MFQLDDLYRQTYHATVDRGDFSVTIRVDGYVRRVTVLVLAVAGGAANSPIVRGRAKSGVHIEVDVGDRLVAVPARDLLNYQLEFVQ